MNDYAIFTEQMKQTHTILVPSMLNIHFSLILEVFKQKGYKIDMLVSSHPALIESGLKYVHNDICYPCLLVIGQFIDALKSGKYDLSRIALAITQTGGGCRASNYIHLLRSALKEAGYGHIPVLSINFNGLEKTNALRFSLPMLKKARNAVIFGDMLMLMSNHFKAYEVEKGVTMSKVWHWVDILKNELACGFKRARRLMREIYEDFSTIKIYAGKKTRVGIVGEIYVKFSPLGNNNLEDFLLKQDCEPVVPGLMGFIMYTIANGVFDTLYYGKNRLTGFIMKRVIAGMHKWDLLIKDTVGDDARFVPSGGIKHLCGLCDGVIDTGVKMGEGWLLPAEMAELLESGVNNIICAQPFGCLPNHIVGKSVIKRLKEIYPHSNITPIDYDASATRVNQENRIKLMLSVAKEG